ncbi:anhydro-N-acetylmuramic acid kinase [Alphaproteobacteria bacterium]|nr:anhydro-N-acetylmuramic acid kinase [Alphaproteobacteria bacterium]
MSNKNNNKYVNAMGLMSGTSCDAIDLSVINTDGINIKSVIKNDEYKYTDNQQKIIKSAYGKNPDPNLLNKATDIITQTHCEIIKKFLTNNKTKIDIIGFHGQTTYHQPQDKITIQIGDAQFIANKFKIPVVADFRKNDIKNGGNGAPLIPVYHQAIANTKKLNNVCFLNLGGIANITVCNNDDLIAFDTGPANCLIDDYCQNIIGIRYDKDGEIAKQGIVSLKIVDEFLQHEFFKKPFPKSLDRNEFAIDFNSSKWNKLNHNDALATLNYISAKSFKIAINQLNKKPEQIIICGGGSHNKNMMNIIQEISNIKTTQISNIGFDNDYIESQGFAFLAVRYLNKLKSSFAITTGVNKPTIAGKIFKPN